MKKIINVLTFIILFFLCTGTIIAQTIDKIVAIVNEEIILQSDVDRVLATIETEYKRLYLDLDQLKRKLENIEQNIINQMIEEKLILCEAKQYNITAEEQVIEKKLQQLKQGFSSDEVFEQALATEGLTLRDLRERFRDQEIMKKAVDVFVRFKLNIDPVEIRQFYDAHKENFKQPERVRLKNILIKFDQPEEKPQALKKAKMILERLKNGDSFEELARLYSQGTNAEDGGHLGFVTKGQFIKEIDEAIFKLQPGEFSDAIKTENGYRIFKVEEKKPAKALSFSEAQNEIKSMLYEREFTQLFQEWIEQLKQNAYICVKQ